MIFLYLYNTHIDIIIEDEIKSLPYQCNIISTSNRVSWFTISQYQLCHVLVPVILTQIRGGIMDKMTQNHIQCAVECFAWGLKNKEKRCY